MSVFDIDSKEGKSQDDPHWGRHTEDGVDGGVDSGLLDPLVSSVLGRFSPVARPGDGMTALHVESPGHSWVLSHTQLLLSCRQELSETQSQWDLRCGAFYQLSDLSEHFPVGCYPWIWPDPTKVNKNLISDFSREFVTNLTCIFYDIELSLSDGNLNNK